jgi:hypothetical protein
VDCEFLFNGVIEVRERKIDSRISIERARKGKSENAK